MNAHVQQMKETLKARNVFMVYMFNEQISFKWSGAKVDFGPKNVVTVLRLQEVEYITTELSIIIDIDSHKSVVLESVWM